MNRDIIQCFTQYPLNDTDNRLDWFNTIVQLLFELQPQPLHFVPHHRGALIAWKATPGGIVKYASPVVVSFNNLYVHSMLTLSNDFTVVDFQTTLGDLMAARQRCTDATVRYSIKAFMNTIYGQMNTGTIRHATASTADVARIAYEVVQALYDHDCAVYADTDEVVFVGLTINEVCAIVDKAIGNTTFPYEVSQYESIEIRGKKKVILGR